MMPGSLCDPGMFVQNKRMEGEKKKKKMEESCMWIVCWSNERKSDEMFIESDRLPVFTMNVNCTL